METVKSSVTVRRPDGPYWALLILASFGFGSLAHADDNQGLKRGGDPNQVSISGAATATSQKTRRRSKLSNG